MTYHKGNLGGKILLVATLTAFLAGVSPAVAGASTRSAACPFLAPLLAKGFEGVKLAEFSDSGEPASDQFEVCGFHIGDPTSYEITLGLKVRRDDGPSILKADTRKISSVHDPGLKVKYVQEQNESGGVIRFLWAYDSTDAKVVTVQEWGDSSSRSFPKFDMKDALLIVHGLLAVTHTEHRAR